MMMKGIGDVVTLVFGHFFGPHHNSRKGLNLAHLIESLIERNMISYIAPTMYAAAGWKVPSWNGLGKK